MSAFFAQSAPEVTTVDFVAFALMVMIGLLLWAAGRVILRPAVVIVGLLAGVVLGFLTGESGATSLSPWIVAAIGGTVLAIAAFIAHRLVLIGAMAGMMAILAMAGAGLTASLKTPPADAVPRVSSTQPAAPEERDEISTWLEEYVKSINRTGADELVDSTADSAEQSVGRATDAPWNERTRTYVLKLEDFAHKGIDAGRSQWDRTPKSHRPMLLIAAVFGALLGTMLGVIAPVFSSAAVSAIGGAWLWLTGARSIALHLGLVESPILPDTPVQWLVLGLIISLIGLAIQWTTRSPTADKPTEENATQNR